MLRDDFFLKHSVVWIGISCDSGASADCFSTSVGCCEWSVSFL